MFSDRTRCVHRFKSRVKLSSYKSPYWRKGKLLWAKWHFSPRRSQGQEFMASDPEWAQRAEERFWLPEEQKAEKFFQPDSIYIWNLKSEKKFKATDSVVFSSLFYLFDMIDYYKMRISVRRLSRKEHDHSIRSGRSSAWPAVMRGFKYG